MFIALCGGTCAGKTSIAQFLEKEHGFKRLTLAGPNSAKTEAKDEPHYFTTPDELLAFVTSNWLENWVLEDLSDYEALEIFSRRPFFLLISVDAPITLRYARYCLRQEQLKQSVPSLESFVADNDRYVYAHPFGLARVIHRAKINLLNDFSDLKSLYDALEHLDLTDESRLRPSWDQYFMELADLAAKRSNCMKRLVGCVLVREKRVISTGYNGTPRGMNNCNQGGCPRCNAAQKAGVGLDTCLCLHAEENALLEAGRERIREGSTLYCNTCPCLTCSVKIAQVGISEVVYSYDYSVDSKAASIFEEAGVKLRQFIPPTAGLVDMTNLSLPNQNKHQNIVHST